MAVLDASQPQPVQYCIQNWLRDEQVKINCARTLPGVEPVATVRVEPIAIVCYGPSLNDTWEQVRDYQYIMTGSGAHRFLLDRGIVPTWHVEVDPRPHKITLMGAPDPRVEYLIPSCCHPAVFDHLEGQTVKMWHAYSAEDDWMRMLPAGAWALTGGSNVGLRQMAMARFLGFTEQHIFGMDGCEGPTGKHAAAHPMQAETFDTTVYRGVEYRTTPAFLECARRTFHELDEMPDVRATFFGEGLVQAMAKDYVRKDRGDQPALLAIQKPTLISPELKALNAQLHRDNLAFGVGGGKHAEIVKKLAASLKTDGVVSVLDFGCGKGHLAKALSFPIWEYDPAVPGKDESPRKADLVVATDVLEHIEPDRLVFVLGELKRCVQRIGYFTIHMGAARKTYADGRNTHLIQKGATWWEGVLAKFFTVAKVWKAGKELHVLVTPKAKKKAA